MGKITDTRAANAVATSAAASATKTLQSQINLMQGEIKKALPAVLTPERFTRMVLSAVSANKDLAACETKSFLAAMMQAAQLGLEPNTPLGQAYIIPYKDHGVLKAQFQIGYKGLIDLAYRSGEVTIIDAQAVHKNDEFEYEYGLDPKLKFKPALTDRGEVIAYYAMFKTKMGGFNFLVMSKEDIINHAKQYSQSYSNSYSPWKTNFDSMAKKTVLKQVLKYAPLKSEFAKKLDADETIKTNIQPNMVDMEDETEPINVTPVENVQANEEAAPPDEIVPFGDED